MLQDLTANKHCEAALHPFNKLMLSGRIDPEFYAIFLHNQYIMYMELETIATQHSIIDGLYDIRRAYTIKADRDELWIKDKTFPILPVISQYSDHLDHLSKTDPDRLFAHIFARHLGNLNDSQPITKRVPGKGLMFQFIDPEKSKQDIISRVTDELADEVNICYNFMIQTYNEMMNLNVNKQMDIIN